MPVALLAEGVDRNNHAWTSFVLDNMSPSSRRAWIEIVYLQPGIPNAGSVALLAEGVDRNCKEREDRHIWAVALLAEGVDRNTIPGYPVGASARRPPRGGRG